MFAELFTPEQLTILGQIISDKPGDGKKIIYHSWVQVEYTGSFVKWRSF